MRRFLADTFALVVFSTIGGAFVEPASAGLTWGQTIGIRLAAIPVILLAGRPCGIYRDWLFRLANADSGGQLKATIIDTSANVSQVPVYSALLALNGATAGQIVTAVGSVMLVIVVSGRPYGLFLVWRRRLFRVPSGQ